MSTAEPSPGRPPRGRRALLGAGLVAAVGLAGVIAATTIGEGPAQETGRQPGAPALPAPAANAPMIVPPSQPPAAGTTAASPTAPAASWNATPFGAPAAANGAAPSAATRSSAAAPEVDDSALRYFLQQGDVGRAQAEMQRLHRLYPAWEPPADLFDPNAPRPSDVQPIWDLFAAGDFAAARKAIADRQAAEPGWTPPSDLVAALDQAAERQRLLNAADTGQWETVLSVADASPTILTCDHVEVLWRVAEAFAKTGAEQRSVDVESYIMRNCAGAPVKVASLQKAIGFLSLEKIETLLGMAVDPPASDPAFDPVRLEIARRQVSAANDDPAIVVPEAALATLAQAAGAAEGAADALLLGFYAYRHADAQGAAGWFLYALQHGGGAKAAEGYVLAMHDLGRQIEAEPVAYEWRSAGRENMAAYLTSITTALTTGDAAQIEQGLLDRFSRTVADERSPLGAQALGWYAYNAAQPEVAADWFAASLAWHPSEVAAFGLGLAYRSLGDVDAFRDVLRTWGGEFPRLPELFLQRPEGEAVSGSALSSYVARRGGRAGEALDAATGMAAPATRGRAASPASAAERTEGRGTGGTGAARSGPDGATRSAATGEGCGGAAAGTVAAGWCLMDQNRPFEAATAFEQAGGSEAAYGRALAYLRMGLTRDAALAAASAPLDAARRRELDTSIVTQQAIDAYDRGKFTEALETLEKRRAFATEQTDLLMLRGWSYYELGDLESARRMFEAVDAVAPSGDTRRALNAVNQRMAPTNFRDR